MHKIDIKSLEYDMLEAFVKDLGQPKFRANQIFGWLHQKLVTSFSEMKNLPQALISQLEEAAEIRNAVIRRVQESKIDGTRKYLFEMNDGSLIESVMMRYQHGISVCVSSQVGCNMGCAFCASTLDGCKRDLTASEILSQIYEIQKDIGERVSHIVIMGMGEPLVNYNHVTTFVRLVSAENALHISQRNITISTCGIVPAIRKMADDSLKVTLALSLHAPNDKIRRQIMPIANKFPLEEVLKACDYYFEKTGRRMTFEYCLMHGVNDSDDNARELAALLKGKNAHVNLIPVNPATDNGFVEGTEKDIDRFQKLLENAKINVTRRREIGRDIDGACGQLVRRKL